MPDTGDLSVFSLENKNDFFKSKINRLAILALFIILGVGLIVFFSAELGIGAEPASPSSPTSGVPPAELPPLNVLYPELYINYGENDEWELRHIQPILKGFETRAGNNYMVVDANGTEFLVFVSGTVETAIIEEIYASLLTNQKAELISFEELQEALTVDQRIGIIYISEFPSNDVRTIEYCQQNLFFCRQAAVVEAFKFNGTYQDISKGVKSDKILPAYKVYTDVYTE